MNNFHRQTLTKLFHATKPSGVALLHEILQSIWDFVEKFNFCIKNVTNLLRQEFDKGHGNAD
jgi:hypothetical protein